MVQDVSKELIPNEVNVFVIQGLDFFAEVPTLDDALPPARGAANAAVVLVLRDMSHVTSTAIRWLDRYAASIKQAGGTLILADIAPSVVEVMKKGGLLETLGESNVIPSTERVLEAENQAWIAGRKWLVENSKAVHSE